MSIINIIDHPTKGQAASAAFGWLVVGLLGLVCLVLATGGIGQDPQLAAENAPVTQPAVAVSP